MVEEGSVMTMRYSFVFNAFSVKMSESANFCGLVTDCERRCESSLGTLERAAEREIKNEGQRNLTP